ncbi:MAG: hypothetical protein CL532_01410 [Aestuariivita sp.]|nr:hypothetical protein [Aestuariivita sp.]|tara:strand:+ start:3117 stop:4736 length:1620 start_codon:yes stop_codon:yes gene_type:complete
MATVSEGVSTITVGKTTPIPAGQATSAQSLPVVVASDQSPIPILDNLSAPSQVRDDLLGIPRTQVPLAIFDDTNLVDISQNVWATNEQVTGGVRVTQVNHILQQSAAEVLLTPGASNGNIARLITKQSFPYQTGRITSASFGVALSRDSNATQEFGMFDTSDGYFVRVTGDELFFVRRTSSGERPQDHLKGYTQQGSDPVTFTVDAAVMTAQPSRTDSGTIYKLVSSSPTIMEEIVPRSRWNGDTMVGENGAALIGAVDSNSVHQLSLTNLCMSRVEFGWYGGTGARLLFYVPVDANLPSGEVVKTARWVIAHNLNCSDRISYPSLGNPTLPMQFRAEKTGSLNANAYIRKYGAQVTIDGGDFSKLDIYSEDGAKVTGVGTSTFKPLLAIRIKELITNNQGESKRNLMRVFPLMLSMVSSHRAQFILVKNPTTMTDSGTAAVTTFASTGTLSAIEQNNPDSSSNAISAFTGGEQLASFFTGDADATTESLTDIFSFARQYLTRESTAASGLAGDVLVIAARSLDNSSNTVKAAITWGQR